MQKDIAAYEKELIMKNKEIEIIKKVIKVDP